MFSLLFVMLSAVPAFSKVPNQYIDNHAHVACFGYGSDCYFSDRMKSSFKFPIYQRLFNFTEEEAKKFGDSYIFKKIDKEVQESKYVKQIVMLAMDQIYNKDGSKNTKDTEFYVPNVFVATSVKKYTTLLFGASVHPYRKDALEELEYVKNNGAVLVKLLPAIQHFSADDKDLIPFYNKLKQLKLPLLIHMDDEHSFTGVDHSYSDPRKLELPLSLGVTVICAHFASLGERGGVQTTTHLKNLMDKYPNLYADISALTQVRTRRYHIEKIMNFDKKYQDRLIYGSDFPLVHPLLASPLYYMFGLGLSKAWSLHNMSNRWDQDVLMKKAFGVPEAVFLRTESLLGLADKTSPSD